MKSYLNRSFAIPSRMINVFNGDFINHFYSFELIKMGLPYDATKFFRFFIKPNCCDSFLSILKNSKMLFLGTLPV